jgi:hypothetical protein
VVLHAIMPPGDACSDVHLRVRSCITVSLVDAGAMIRGIG